MFAKDSNTKVAYSLFPEISLNINAGTSKSTVGGVEEQRFLTEFFIRKIAFVHRI